MDDQEYILCAAIHYDDGQEHIGGITKEMFMFIVGGPQCLGPTGRDSCKSGVNKPNYILKRSFEGGYFPKGTLACIPKKRYLKPGWTCYDDTANENGVHFSKTKGYWTKPRITFINENGGVLFCREKSGKIIDRALAIFDCDDHTRDKYFKPIRKHK